MLAVLFLGFLSLNTYAKGFGVGKIENNQRPDLNIKEIIENNGYTMGEDDNRIYLTFDCGYENGYTMSMLDTLKENEIKAAFFITGHYLTSSKDIVKRMIDDGHLVCNHTNKHKSFETVSLNEMMEDITSLEKMYNEAFGLEMIKYVRPPKGEFTNESMKCLSENGYKTIFWSLAYVDWDKDKYFMNHYSYDNVMKRIHNGAIILMHTVSKDNMMDLNDIVVKLKENYTFSSLEEL